MTTLRRQSTRVGGRHRGDPRRSARMAAAGKRGRVGLCALAFRVVLRAWRTVERAPSRSSVGARCRRPRLRHPAPRLDRPRRTPSIGARAGDRSQDRQGRRKARPTDRRRQVAAARALRPRRGRSSCAEKARSSAVDSTSALRAGGFAEHVVPLDEPARERPLEVR